MSEIERQTVGVGKAEVAKSNLDDKRLDRLYDYTKFHIGIYLSMAGGLAGLISLAANKDSAPAFGRALAGPPIVFLAIAFVFVALAGMAGAIVATSVIESETYEGFLRSREGAFGWRLFVGKTWVTLEHAFFWVSLALLTVTAILVALRG